MRPKTLVSCCGYTSAQGIAAPWECPGCGTVHTDHVPDVEAGPEPFEAVPPGQGLGAVAAVQDVRGSLPAL